MTDTKADLKARKKELDLAEQELTLQIKQHELAKAKADAEEAELKAESLRYDLEHERKRERRRKAQEAVENEYDFHAEINNVTVRDFTDWLATRRLVDKAGSVVVNINSPGGSVFAGFVMMDAIREAREDGVHVTAKVSGMAASMAGIIAQAADKRLIGKESYLMLHEVSSGMFGGYKLSELADEKEFSERLTRQAMDWFARRSDGKWEIDALMANIHKYDWWLSATEALEAGFVDGVF